MPHYRVLLYRKKTQQQRFQYFIEVIHDDEEVPDIYALAQNYLTIPSSFKFLRVKNKQKRDKTNHEKIYEYNIEADTVESVHHILNSEILPQIFRKDKHYLAAQKRSQSAVNRKIEKKDNGKVSIEGPLEGNFKKLEYWRIERAIHNAFRKLKKKYGYSVSGAMAEITVVINKVCYSATHNSIEKVQHKAVCTPLAEGGKSDGVYGVFDSQGKNPCVAEGFSTDFWPFFTAELALEWEFKNHPEKDPKNILINLLSHLQAVIDSAEKEYPKCHDGLGNIKLFVANVDFSTVNYTDLKKLWQCVGRECKYRVEGSNGLIRWFSRHRFFCLGNTRADEIDLVYRAVFYYEKLSQMTNNRIYDFTQLINAQIILDFIDFLDKEMSRLRDSSTFLSHPASKIRAYLALRHYLLDYLAKEDLSASLDGILNKAKDRIFVERDEILERPSLVEKTEKIDVADEDQDFFACISTPRRGDVKDNENGSGVTSMINFNQKVKELTQIQKDCLKLANVSSPNKLFQSNIKSTLSLISIR